MIAPNRVNGRAKPSEEQLEAELLKLARSRQSGTKVQARVAALRTVLRRRQQERQRAERAERERSREAETELELIWPSETPSEPVPVGYWPYDGTLGPDAASWEPLDMHDTQGARDAARIRREGPPPWRRRRSP